MKLIEITPAIIVNPDEVVSIQEERVDMMNPSGSTTWESIGSVMTLKNGRKMFVDNQTPTQVLAKLKPEFFAGFIVTDEELENMQRKAGKR